VKAFVLSIQTVFIVTSGRKQWMKMFSFVRNTNAHQQSSSLASKSRRELDLETFPSFFQKQIGWI
jgi:hypothetical protein